MGGETGSGDAAAGRGKEATFSIVGEDTFPGAEDINSAGGKEVDSTEDGEAASTGGGEISSTGKEDLSVFRGSMSPASSASSHTFPSQFAGSHYFLINAFTLTVDTLQG